MEDRKYIVFNISEVSKIDFNEVIENSADKLRTSYNGQKTFVKYKGDNPPSFLNSLETVESVYSYEEMMIVLSTEEWTKPNPIKE